MTFIFDLDDMIMVKISIEGEKSESVIDFLQIYVWKCRGILVWTLDSCVCGRGSNPLKVFFLFFLCNLNKFCIK